MENKYSLISKINAQCSLIFSQTAKRVNKVELNAPAAKILSDGVNLKFNEEHSKSLFKEEIMGTLNGVDFYFSGNMSDGISAIFYTEDNKRRLYCEFL